jgi:hypothetical protein
MSTLLTLDARASFEMGGTVRTMTTDLVAPYLEAIGASPG